MSPRRQIIVVAAALALVGALDFFQRVYVPRSAAVRDADLNPAALPPPPLSLAAARQRLQDWFPTGAPASALLSEEPDGVSELRAAVPDRGKLGGWRFVLRGVFDGGPPFAVLDVGPSAGGAVEPHRLSAGEVVNGVRVVDIHGSSVVLSDGENTIRLALFIDPADTMAPDGGISNDPGQRSSNDGNKRQ